MSRHLLGFVPIAALAVAAAGAGVVAQPMNRTIYVSVLAADGTPVTDLSSADFGIKDGGKACEIVKAEVTSTLMQVAIIVDDNGTGFFRAGVATFINKLNGHARFAISQVNGQTQRLTDFTTDMDVLSAAVGRINARPATNEGGQLLEAIYEYSRQIEKMEAQRPVIVALTVGGEEHSTRDPKQVLDQLQKSGAILHVAQVAGSVLRPTAPTTKPSDLLEGNMSLGEVLGDGPKQSGGRRAEVVATNGLVPQLQSMAEAMLRQYAVTYTLPSGVKPTGRLAVSLNNKKGLTLVAPTRVPAR
jgi:VWFA-related protein